MFVLRDFQRECVAEMDKKQSGLLLAPTGSGKTVMGLALAWKEVKLRKGKVAFIVPRDNLAQQTARSAIAWGLSVGFVLGGQPENRTADLQIITYQSLGSFRRSLDWLYDSITTSIIDEAHITAFTQSLEGLKRRRILGLTATPWQMGRKRSLLEVFDEVVFAPNPGELIKKGFLAQPIHFCPKNKGKLDPSPEFVFHWWEKLAYNEKTFCFANSISQAEAIASRFREQGIEAIAITSKTPAKQVEEVLREFGLPTSKYRVLTTCNKLAEGCDSPDATCVILANRTESKSGAVQRIGRGARIAPGKTHFKVIDCVGITRKFGMFDELNPTLEDFALDDPRDGEALHKDCDRCYGANHISAKLCKYCGHPFEIIRDYNTPDELTRVAKNEQESRAIASFHALLLQDFLGSTQKCEQEFLKQFGYYPLSNWITDAQLPPQVESAAVKAAWRQFKRVTGDRLPNSVQLPLPQSSSEREEWAVRSPRADSPVHRT